MNEDKEGAPPGVVATIGRFCCRASDGNIYDLRAGVHRVRACRPALSAWRRVPDRGSLRGMTISSNPYRGFRFPREVIEHAVWFYELDPENETGG
jgi:hypothetical protein